MGKNQDAQNNINHLIEQLTLGNDNPGMSSQSIGGGIFELMGANGGRAYYRELQKKDKTVYKVLNKLDKTNQEKVIILIKQYYL